MTAIFYRQALIASLQENHLLVKNTDSIICWISFVLVIIPQSKYTYLKLMILKSRIFPWSEDETIVFLIWQKKHAKRQKKNRPTDPILSADLDAHTPRDFAFPRNFFLPLTDPCSTHFSYSKTFFALEKYWPWAEIEMCTFNYSVGNGRKSNFCDTHLKETQDDVIMTR